MGHDPGPQASAATRSPHSIWRARSVEAVQQHGPLRTTPRGRPQPRRAGSGCMRGMTLALAIAALGVAGGAQSVTSKYSRKSDVIYGRKAGLALTMEVLAPVRSNGLGVVWVVSSGGKSSPEQTREPSFER